MTLLATVTFFLSAALLLYVLFGYPLLVHFLARLRPRPVRKGPVNRSVSIILPVRNGEPWIAAKLQSILGLQFPHNRLEVLVISDGSTDNTEQIVRAFQHQGVRLLSIAPQGKATALNVGMLHATGDILFFTDVRQLLAPESLRNLLACFADPAVGVVSGELVIQRGNRISEEHVGLYWRYEKWIRKNLSRIDSVLGATGAIYAIHRDLATPLPPDTLLDDVHLPLAAFFQGFRVVLEESARAIDEPASLHTEFRRKVRTLAGVYQVIAAYPALLTFSNRMWFHFVSHKLARQFLPFLLILLAASSLALPNPWAAPAAAAQAIFYALAALDLVLPEEIPLKRITSAARTFVVLMAAALCALSFFFAPTRSLWVDTRKQR